MKNPLAACRRYEPRKHGQNTEANVDILAQIAGTLTTFRASDLELRNAGHSLSGAGKIVLNPYSVAVGSADHEWRERLINYLLPYVRRQNSCVLPTLSDTRPSGVIFNSVGGSYIDFNPGYFVYLMTSADRASPGK